MNQKERNAYLQLQPDENRPSVIRNAQMLFLVGEISRRGLTVTSRPQLLKIIKDMDAEVQEIAGVQTAPQREDMADRWDDIRFLVEMIDAGGTALIERTGRADEEFFVGEDPDLRRTQEILRQRRLIRKKPRSKIIKSKLPLAIVLIAFVSGIVVMIAFAIALSRGIGNYPLLNACLVALLVAIICLSFVRWLIATVVLKPGPPKRFTTLREIGEEVLENMPQMLQNTPDEKLDDSSRAVVRELREFWQTVHPPDWEDDQSRREFFAKLKAALNIARPLKDAAAAVDNDDRDDPRYIASGLYFCLENVGTRWAQLLLPNDPRAPLVACWPYEKPDSPD